MDRRSAVSALSGVRLAIGASAWVAPRLAGRLFGLDSAGNPQAPYLARLFGARDVALAWGALSTDGEAQRRWLLAGAACDAADSLAGVAGTRAGYLPPFTGALVSGTAVGALLLGVRALASG